MLSRRKKSTNKNNTPALAGIKEGITSTSSVTRLSVIPKEVF